MKVNFDTKAELDWTDEAKAALLRGNPAATYYSGFSGLPIEVLPEIYKKRLADR
jgi:hypothetical protein